MSLSAEDAKLVTLARAARGRAYLPPAADAPAGAGAQAAGGAEGAGGAGGAEGAEGAAVRDTDGRTYAGATVGHPDPALATGALRAAVVAAASSGARRFEAAAVVTDRAQLASGELAVLAQFGAGVPVHLADPDGTVVTTVTTTVTTSG